jgi:molecular chaperone GrpE
MPFPDNLSELPTGDQHDELRLVDRTDADRRIELEPEPQEPVVAAAKPAAPPEDYYDLLLRKTAEFDNYRKRVERERRELSDYVVGEFVKELLPVIDDFTRALGTEPTTNGNTAFRQGVELIHKRLLDALAKRGVTVIDPLGEAFNPHEHEAVARVPAWQDTRDGEVVEVFSPGYKLGDRLLRPAIVKVATA